MPTLWETVGVLEQRATTLAKAVQRAVMPAAARSREFVTLFQQEIEVDQYNLATQNSTWTNGDIDTVELWRLAMAVSKNDAPSTKPNKRVMLSRGYQGWVEAGIGSRDLTVDIDLRWNVVVGSRQTRYARDHFANPEMLVGLDKGRALDFRAPIIIPRGEQLEFYVEPTNFAIPLTSEAITQGSVKYYVSFLGMGFRRSA